jgi:hypothetical protein
MATAVSEKRLCDAIEEVHDTYGDANGGAGAGAGWLCNEQRFDECDLGPDVASDVLENPSIAEFILVTLGKTDGNIDIVPANELEVGVSAYGLYNLAELGFTDKDANAFIENTTSVEELQTEVGCQHGRLIELKSGIEHCENILMSPEPIASDLSDVLKEKEGLQAEHAVLKETYTMCKTELDMTLLAIHVFTNRVRRRVTETRKPFREPVRVLNLLQKYSKWEEELAEMAEMAEGDKL